MFDISAELSTISAHGRALKLQGGKGRDRRSSRLSTISAHGRALKHDSAGMVARDAGLSTISAHGRALKPGLNKGMRERKAAFQQFRLTVEH